MMIYVAHPYSDDPVGNMAKVELKLKLLRELNPGEVYISPLHTFSWQQGIATYEETMKDCMKLLSHCDKAVFCEGWYDSPGCQREMRWCKGYGIRIEVEE